MPDLDAREIPWQSYAVPVTTTSPDPLPGHQAPLDRRHRWSYQRSDAHGHWYRCRTCHRRKRVTHLLTLIQRKTRDAERAIDDHLTEILWRAPA